MSRDPQFARSRALLAKAVEIDASVFRLPGILATEVGVSAAPSFASHASGPYVFDVDGNRYIDFVLGFGSVILGHASPTVDEAVLRQIRSGIGPTLLTETQLEFCRLLTEIVPGAEMALPLRSGSDATGAAVRLARAYTGRSSVLRWGYAGWHDWCAPRRAGIPKCGEHLVSELRYNDLAFASESIRNVAADLACVIMMPYEIDTPEPGFLENIARMAHEVGALFILDEVRSGFRLALGGAQEYFGVTADLVALSKALGNGYCVSAVTGRTEIMRVSRELSVSSVFYRHADGMAAAVATVSELRDSDGLSAVWSAGEMLMAGLRAEAQSLGIPLEPVGLPPTPFVRFRLGAARDDAAAMRLFCSECLKRGVIVHPTHHWFTCVTMSQEVIAEALHAMAGALKVVGEQMS